MTEIGLTLADMAKLAYPFQPHEHEFIQGFVYIREEAIANRLDKIDPNWKFEPWGVFSENGAISVMMLLTIKGVTRANMGTGIIQTDRADTDKNGNKTGTFTLLPLYTIADNTGNNGYKGGTTDSLKRCARLFGVGRYLLSAPKKGDLFNTWLAQKLAEAAKRWKDITVEAIENTDGTG